MATDESEPKFSVKSIAEISGLSRAKVRRKLQGIPGTKVGRSILYPQSEVKSRFLPPTPDIDSDRQFWHAIGGIQLHGRRRT